jgi:hypothetical protein
VANIENVTMAHIHVAPAGVNGPVVVWLYPEGPPPVTIPGRFSGVLATDTITDEDVIPEAERDDCPGLEVNTFADLLTLIDAGEDPAVAEADWWTSTRTWFPRWTTALAAWRTCWRGWAGCGREGSPRSLRRPTSTRA